MVDGGSVILACVNVVDAATTRKGGGDGEEVIVCQVARHRSDRGVQRAHRNHQKKNAQQSNREGEREVKGRKKSTIDTKKNSAD